MAMRHKAFIENSLRAVFWRDLSGIPFVMAKSTADYRRRRRLGDFVGYFNFR
jgi:hypothetical protein